MVLLIITDNFIKRTGGWRELNIQVEVCVDYVVKFTLISLMGHFESIVY